MSEIKECNKYNIIPGFTNYIIFPNGFIQVLNDIDKYKTGDYIDINYDKNTVNIFSDKLQKFIDVDIVKLITYIFIGVMNLPIKYKKSIAGYNQLNYVLNPLDVIYNDNDTITILGKEFTRIPFYSIYFISKDGIIYSTKKKCFLKKSFNKVGYLRLSLTNDSNIYSDKLVHKLVYATFVGNIPKGFHLDHVDNNKLNNSADNLQPLNPKDNAIKSLRHHNISKWSDEELHNICKQLSEGLHVSVIAKNMTIPENEYSAFKNLCSKIRSRTIWTHISSGYDFSNYKYTKWDNDDIEFICKSMSEGVSVSELYKHYNITDEHAKGTFKTMCHGLRHKKVWKSISTKYDYHKYHK